MFFVLGVLLFSTLSQNSPEFHRKYIPARMSTLEGSKGGPKEWGSQVTTGLIAFYSRLFQTLMLTHAQTPFIGTPLATLRSAATAQ